MKYLTEALLITLASIGLGGLAVGMTLTALGVLAILPTFLTIVTLAVFTGIPAPETQNHIWFFWIVVLGVAIGHQLYLNAWRIEKALDNCYGDTF